MLSAQNGLFILHSWTTAINSIDGCNMMGRPRSSKEQDPRREELKRQAEEAKAKSEEIHEIAGRIQEENALISDIADLATRVAHVAPAESDWETPIGEFQRLNRGLDTLLPVVRNLAGSSQLVYSTTASGISISGLTTGQLIPPGVAVPIQDRREMDDIRQELHLLAERHGYKDRALNQMRRLGLDQTTKGKEAIQQFEAAWETYLQKPSSPTSSVIPLRQAIIEVIGELIRMRPEQRKVGREKIVEIGAQSAADYVTLNDFHRLQAEWYVLADRLSQAKAIVDRQTERELMSIGTSFLIELLSAIDSARLRH